MPQIQVFQCPACGANLSYDGGPEITFPCQFCGTTIIVPEKLRSQAAPEPAAAPFVPVAPSAALSDMLAGLPLDKLTELKRLVQSGQKIEAIVLYRQIFPGVGLTEAKDAVEKLEAGQPLVLSSTSVEMPRVAAGSLATDQAARLVEVMQLALAGKKIEAIKLYRETFGVGLREAVEAVEQAAQGQPLNVTVTSVESSNAAEPDRAARLAAVAELARAGQKLEAIKLYRTFYGVGLREAKDAVEAMSAGAGVARTFPASQARRAGKVIGCGSLGCALLFTAGIIGFVVAMIYLPFRLSGSFRQALDAARSDPSVIDALGAPVEASWWPGGGEISCGLNSCAASYNIPIHGSRKSGYIWVKSNSSGASFMNEGTWTLNATVYVNGGPTIDLRPQAAASRGPTPVLLATQLPIGTATLSPAQADATAGADAKIVRQAATATAGAEATATAEARATAAAIITAQADWSVVAEESFTNTGLGWPTGKYPDDDIQVTAQLQSGKYLWAVVPLHGNTYVNLLPKQGPTFGDFYAAVDIKFTEGRQDGNAAYGLVFRRVNRDYGFFGLQPDGTVRLLTVFGGGIYTQVILGTSASHSGLGETNRLAVRAIDADFVFVLNDEVVWQLNEDFSPGEIGLGVDAMQKGPLVKVEFSDFEVRAPK